MKNWVMHEYKCNGIVYKGHIYLVVLGILFFYFLYYVSAVDDLFFVIWLHVKRECIYKSV